MFLIKTNVFLATWIQCKRALVPAQYCTRQSICLTILKTIILIYSPAMMNIRFPITLCWQNLIMKSNIISASRIHPQTSLRIKYLRWLIAKLSGHIIRLSTSCTEWEPGLTCSGTRLRHSGWLQSAWGRGGAATNRPRWISRPEKASTGARKLVDST